MSEDTGAAFNHYVQADQVTFSSTSGKTVAEVTAQHGSPTSSVVDWLVRERLFETTAAHIIIFSGFLFLFIGLTIGVFATRNNPRQFVLNNTKYELAGVGEILNGDKKVYAPVYEVTK